jgi:shikimate dehydrogenase
MQNAALAAAGLGATWRYQLLPAPPELFDEIVRALPAAGFRGANVTIPHKAAALALATAPSDRARSIGAANTLLFAPDGTIAADNTDAPAIVNAIPFGLSGATALVLGAGGSARAAVWALRDAGAREVRVWNRTHQRAQRLAAALGARAVTEIGPADVLVNCTAVGLHGEDPFTALPLAPGDLHGVRAVADFVYTATPSALLAAAAGHGAATVDGLELLVQQGALALEAFTGRPAPVAVMRAAARGTS